MAEKRIPSLLQGVYINNNDVRVSRPLNMVPIAKDTGIGNVYFRSLDGVQDLDFALSGGGEIDNAERGGYLFQGKQIRVFGRIGYEIDIGTKSIVPRFTLDTPKAREDGSVVSDDSPVQFAESFKYLAIAANGYLYLWNGDEEFVKVDTSAVEAGYIIDVVFVAGFFIFTDGSFVYSTDILDPKITIVGSYDASEFDTDSITGLVNLRNIVYAANRYSIQEYSLTGTGVGFPLQTSSQTLIQRGAINPACFIKYNQDVLVFIGGGRNEQISLFSAVNSSSEKLSTQDEDAILNSLTKAELAQVRLETQVIDDNIFLFVHIPDRPSFVYDYLASTALKTPVWHYRSSSDSADNQGNYNVRSILYVENSGFYVAHPTEGKIGILTRKLSSHWGKQVYWALTSPIAYGGQSHFQVFMHELIPLNIEFTNEATIYRTWSTDGKVFSSPESIKLTKSVHNRLLMLQPLFAANWIITRWSGDGSGELRMAVANDVYNVQALAF